MYNKKTIKIKKLVTILMITFFGITIKTSNGTIDLHLIK